MGASSMKTLEDFSDYVMTKIRNSERYPDLDEWRKQLAKKIVDVFEAVFEEQESTERITLLMNALLGEKSGSLARETVKWCDETLMNHV